MECRHRSSYRSLALLAPAVVALALSGCGSKNDKARLTATEVSWSRLATLVRDCKAKRVDQTHNNLVTVTERDGRKEWGYEPHIDAIIPIVNRAYAHCGPLIFSTE